MADQGGPDRDLDLLRLRVEISQQETNILAAEYRLAQLDIERKKVTQNIEAAKLAIADRQEQLTQMEESGA